MTAVCWIVTTALSALATAYAVAWLRGKDDAADLVRYLLKRGCNGPAVVEVRRG